MKTLKNMNNTITINIEELRLLPDGSIIDAETIRQIGLYSIKFNDSSLGCKIKPGFEFAALYPHVQHVHQVLPDNK